MLLIIHDLKNLDLEKLNLNNDDTKIFGYDDKIKPCIGCFGCWVKTPLECVIKDSYEYNNLLFKEADKVIVISKNCYGMLSPFVKNFFDRSIGYIKPYFVKAYHETHHMKRYPKKLDITYIIYGDNTDKEKETIKKVIYGNSKNFDINYQIEFISNPNELSNIRKVLNE